MLSKKRLAIFTAGLMFASILNSIGTKTLATSIDQLSLNESIFEEGYGGPVDLSIANEEKIIEMLKKEGKIGANVTYKEAQKIYLKYMQDAVKANENQPVNKLDKEIKAKQNQKVQKYVFGQTTPDKNPKKVNVLAVLVQYSDYDHNNITTNESGMYYKDYSKEHFQDMLFGDKGYIGPKGEQLVSMKQYYKEQSGGSLEINGTVTKWYTAPEEAKYYGEEVGSSNDVRPRSLVEHALQEVAKDTSINLSDFDKEDQYDLDRDGIYNEPDGIIDYLMVIHAGVGQEAGGGKLGSSAIWSHSSSLGRLYPIPGTLNPLTSEPYRAYGYTIEPEDGAAGVFAHEFGHNLGLPDEYDTIYSSASNEPISNWSIMSAGSWAGKIPGTEPTGFSPYGKQIFQGLYGGNWQNRIVLDYDKLTAAGARVDLRQASESGQVVQVNLPNREYTINTPTSGKYAYFGGKGTDGNPVNTTMETKISIPSATVAKLQFKTWYDIEEGWDFATVWAREVGQSDWNCLQGNLTTTEHDPQADVIVPYGITGTSDGWVDANYDLSAYVGKNIELMFKYDTDAYTFGAGFYVDDITVSSDNTIVLSDNAEEKSSFELNGFINDTGKKDAKNYYLVEWRNHNGVDKGLANISTLGQTFAYDPGMVVWYVNDYYTENWTGIHPGGAYLSVVDADQNNMLWRFSDNTTLDASGKYQMHDAAFSKNKESKLYLDFTSIFGRSVQDNNIFTEPSFSDKTNYLNPQLPTLGVDLPKLGLNIQISKQDKDNSGASLIIKK